MKYLNDLDTFTRYLNALDTLMKYLKVQNEEYRFHSITKEFRQMNAKAGDNPPD